MLHAGCVVVGPQDTDLQEQNNEFHCNFSVLQNENTVTCPAKSSACDFQNFAGCCLEAFPGILRYFKHFRNKIK